MNENFRTINKENLIKLLAECEDIRRCINGVNDLLTSLVNGTIIDTTNSKKDIDYLIGDLLKKISSLKQLNIVHVDTLVPSVTIDRFTEGVEPSPPTVVEKKAVEKKVVEKKVVEKKVVETPKVRKDTRVKKDLPKPPRKNKRDLIKEGLLHDNQK